MTAPSMKAIEAASAALSEDIAEIITDKELACALAAAYAVDRAEIVAVPRDLFERMYLILDGSEPCVGARYESVVRQAAHLRGGRDAC